MGFKEEDRLLLISLEKAKESIFPHTCRILDTTFVFDFPSNLFDYVQKIFLSTFYIQGLMLRILAFSCKTLITHSSA